MRWLRGVGSFSCDLAIANRNLTAGGASLCRVALAVCGRLRFRMRTIAACMRGRLALSRDARDALGRRFRAMRTTC